MLALCHPTAVASDGREVHSWTLVLKITSFSMRFLTDCITACIRVLTISGHEEPVDLSYGR